MRVPQQVVSRKYFQKVPLPLPSRIWPVLAVPLEIMALLYGSVVTYQDERIYIYCSYNSYSTLFIVVLISFEIV